MRQILLILVILSIAAPAVQAAEGRRTAAVLGFAVGALTGWTARDHMRTEPAPQVIRYRNEYREPVIVERVIVIRQDPPPKEYVIIDGRAYEIVRSR